MQSWTRKKFVWLTTKKVNTSYWHQQHAWSFNSTWFELTPQVSSKFRITKTKKRMNELDMNEKVTQTWALNLARTGEFAWYWRSTWSVKKSIELKNSKFHNDLLLEAEFHNFPLMLFIATGFVTAAVFIPLSGPEASIQLKWCAIVLGLIKVSFIKGKWWCSFRVVDDRAVNYVWQFWWISVHRWWMWNRMFCHETTSFIRKLVRDGICFSLEGKIQGGYARFREKNLLLLH